jgi:hypothetical protein
MTEDGSGAGEQPDPKSQPRAPRPDVSATAIRDAFESYASRMIWVVVVLLGLNLVAMICAFVWVYLEINKLADENLVRSIILIRHAYVFIGVLIGTALVGAGVIWSSAQHSLSYYLLARYGHSEQGQKEEESLFKRLFSFSSSSVLITGGLVLIGVSVQKDLTQLPKDQLQEIKSALPPTSSKSKNGN